MSDSQTYDPVVVSSDGVTVAKRFEADEFPVPAIAFRIESARDETVSVRLVDSVPEDVAVEDLGFHPEYGSEYWTIDDQQITFERDIEAESEYTTVYGIRSTGTDNVEQFLTEPTLEEVDPPLEDDEGDVLNESSSDVVKDVISGDSSSVPGLDDEDDEEIETLNLKDPNAPAEEQANAGGEDSGGSGGGGVSGNVTRALLAEIKRGEVEDELVTALRQTLANGSTGDGPSDARIQHLQNEVSDLAAYTEALEEFLSENGTGEQMISEFRTQLTAFQDELDEIQSMSVQNKEGLNSVQSTVSQVDDRVDSMEGTVDSLESDVDSLDETVDSVEGELESVSGTVEGLQGDIGEIEETVDSVEGRVENVDSIEEGLESAENRLDSMQDDLEEIKSQVGNVSNVDERMDDIENEIEELKQWREQLSSVIGGGE